VGFKPYLKDQLVSFSALTLLVWSKSRKNRLRNDLQCVEWDATTTASMIRVYLMTVTILKTDIDENLRIFVRMMTLCSWSTFLTPMSRAMNTGSVYRP